jgi:hypothetical protein
VKSQKSGSRGGAASHEACDCPDSALSNALPLSDSQRSQHRFRDCDYPQLSGDRNDQTAYYSYDRKCGTGYGRPTVWLPGAHMSGDIDECKWQCKKPEPFRKAA